MLCKLLMLSTQSRDSKYIYSMCKPTCSTTQQNTNRCFIYIYRERERENHAKELAAPLPRCVGDVRRYKPDFSEEDTENRKREWEWNVMLYPPIPAYMGTRIPWIMFGKPIARNSGRKAKHQDLNKGTYRIIEAHCVFCNKRNCKKLQKI